MKVAVSIPDPLFAEADDLARRFGASRSEIYRRALSEFVARHADDPVTRAMNETLDALGPQARAFEAKAAQAALKRSEW